MRASAIGSRLPPKIKQGMIKLLVRKDAKDQDRIATTLALTNAMSVKTKTNLAW